MAKERLRLAKSKVTNSAIRKMQTVQFRDMSDFLEFLPEQELKIVKVLRQIVFDCVPMVTEVLVCNVPYYRVRRNICFIWPAAVLWGKVQTYQGVRFGFTKGYLLQDEIDYLDKGDRKQVYWRDFKDIEEIDVDVLKSYIYEAMQLDVRRES